MDKNKGKFINETLEKTPSAVEDCFFRETLKEAKQHFTMMHGHLQSTQKLAQNLNSIFNISTILLTKTSHSDLISTC
jgi:hypothetical protein